MGWELRRGFRRAIDCRSFVLAERHYKNRIECERYLDQRGITYCLIRSWQLFAKHLQLFGWRQGWTLFLWASLEWQNGWLPSSFSHRHSPSDGGSLECLSQKLYSWVFSAPREFSKLKLLRTSLSWATSRIFIH